MFRFNSDHIRESPSTSTVYHPSPERDRHTYDSDDPFIDHHNNASPLQCPGNKPLSPTRPGTTKGAPTFVLSPGAFSDTKGEADGEDDDAEGEDDVEAEGEGEDEDGEGESDQGEGEQGSRPQRQGSPVSVRMRTASKSSSPHLTTPTPLRRSRTPVSSPILRPPPPPPQHQPPPPCTPSRSTDLLYPGYETPLDMTVSRARTPFDLPRSQDRTPTPSNNVLSPNSRTQTPDNQFQALAFARTPLRTPIPSLSSVPRMASSSPFRPSVSPEPPIAGPSQPRPTTPPRLPRTPSPTRSKPLLRTPSPHSKSKVGPTPSTAGGEIDRIRQRQALDESARLLASEPRRPEYFARSVKRGRSEEDEDGEDEIEREDVVLGVTVTPAKGRRLKLYHPLPLPIKGAEVVEPPIVDLVDEEAVEPAAEPKTPPPILPALDYRAIDWRTPCERDKEREGKPSISVWSEEDVLKKERRLEAFRATEPSGSGASLVPVEAMGKGRILMDAKTTDLKALYDGEAFFFFMFVFVLMWDVYRGDNNEIT